MSSGWPVVGSIVGSAGWPVFVEYIANAIHKNNIDLNLMCLDFECRSSFFCSPRLTTKASRLPKALIITGLTSLCGAARLADCGGAGLVRGQ